MGNSFDPELDFCSGHAPKTQSSELSTFLDLSEHRLRFYRSVAPVQESPFTCQKSSGPGFIIVEGMIDFYLPLPF